MIAPARTKPIAAPEELAIFAPWYKFETNPSRIIVFACCRKCPKIWGLARGWPVGEATKKLLFEHVQWHGAPIAKGGAL